MSYGLNSCLPRRVCFAEREWDLVEEDLHLFFGKLFASHPY